VSAASTASGHGTRAWVHQAACRGTPVRWWFPERGDPFAGQVALTICRSCPVRVDCLAEAIRLESDQWQAHGIRGGLTAGERRALIVG
jgi:hypothetical protein